MAATGTTGARLLSSWTSPNGCGWQCRCAPPVVAGKSERLRDMCALPGVSGEFRRAPWHVAATSTAGARLPSSWAATGMSTCKGSRRKLNSDHVRASDKIKGVVEELLTASSHGPIIAALR